MAAQRASAWSTSDQRPDRPWGPLQFLRKYLLWHATAVCRGTCLLCTDTLTYLVNQGHPVDELELVVVEEAPHDGPAVFGVEGLAGMLGEHPDGQLGCEAPSGCPGE